MSNLHDICKEYDFCSPETRAELEKNGFDFKTCKFGIAKIKDFPCVFKMSYAPQMFTGELLVPYPTFPEVWEKLTPIKYKGDKYWCILYEKSIGFEEEDGYVLRINEGKFPVNFPVDEDTNICEAACQLWVKLKEGGFLNG